MKKTSKNKRPPTPCTRCGRMGYASIPLFLSGNGFLSVTVCFKTVCTHCAHIPIYVVHGKMSPAVYARDGFGRVRLEPREFFLPREMYLTPAGKCDVGKKAELCQAFVRLAVAHPRRNEFTEEELWQEWRRHI